MQPQENPCRVQSSTITMQPQENPCRVLLGLHGDCTEGFFLKNLYCLECSVYHRYNIPLNPLTAGAAYVRVFIFYQHIKYLILNMLKIKCDINQQDLKRVDLHFVKSE